VDVQPTKALVTLSVSSGSQFATPDPGSIHPAYSDVTQSDGSSTLRITRAAVVLRRIELKRQFGAGCPESGQLAEDCHEFEAGPFLLELPMSGGLSSVVTIDVPPGTYDEVEFDIHKPGHSDPDDEAFIARHPDFAYVSIRVEGTFDGQPFVFIQDLGESQEADLSPTLVVDGTAPMTTNLTLEIDLAQWFWDDDRLVDPRSANRDGPNEKLVEDNIEESIEAFEDRDRDGRRDS